MSLSERQKRFAAEYAATGNSAEAARRAGYSERTARTQGARLLTNDDIKAEIKRLQADAEAGRVASAYEIKRYWTDTMNNTAERTTDRLKASELLAKSGGLFLHLPPDLDNAVAFTGEIDGEGVTTVVYIPQMLREEDCQVSEEDDNEI